MPVIQGRKIQMSTWIIHGRFGGMAFRESKNNVFKDGSPFLPHVITDKGPSYKPDVQVYYSSKASAIFSQLYGSFVGHDTRVKATRSPYHGGLDLSNAYKSNNIEYKQYKTCY
jgi:hypothetical protein